MTKILLVNWTAPNENIGGVESLWTNLGKIFTDMGHEVKFVSYNVAAQTLGFNVPYMQLPFPEAEGSMVIDKYLQKYFNLFGGKEDTIIVQNAGTRGWYDLDVKQVSIFNDPYLSLWTNLEKFGFSNPIASNRYKDICIFLQKRCAEQSVKNIALSNYVAQTDLKQMNIKSDYIIPNAVDTQFFKPLNKEEVRKKWKIPDGYEHYVCWSGSFHPLKWEFLPRLIQEFKNTYFILIFKHALQNQRIRSPNVHIFYNIPYQTMPEIYNLGDSFILPSINENCNLSILEAMACGLPICVTKTGMWWDYQPKKAGYFFDWNYDQCKEAVQKMINNSKKFNPRSVAIKKFDTKSWGKKWKKIIESVI